MKEKHYNQEIKADFGKPKISLVPPQIIKDIAEVREYGVKKYGSAESWRKVELERYIDAFLRHSIALIEDIESVDEESRIEHYKHAACNLAFIAEIAAKRKFKKKYRGQEKGDRAVKMH